MLGLVGAPLIEEFCKGLGVFGVFYFLRSEFHGVADGMVYGTFIGLGFAAGESTLHLSKALEGGGLADVYFLRGVSSWIHAVYTVMIGVGFGITRESCSKVTQALAPVGGYMVAVVLHGLWNGVGFISENLRLLYGLILTFAFIVLVVVMIRRRGRVIRENLVDEVAMGTLGSSEFDLACSAFGLFRGRLRHGKKGEEFVRTILRLGLAKWHTARAMTHGEQTVSMDFIVPLRRKIAALRASL